MNGTKALLLDERGAIAPTFALSLFALVAVGGIAFDYARLAAMDSELQNAADQAALAAASQLDGQAGATQRSANAASGLVANSTLFANDGAGTGITIAAVNFYKCSTNACATAKLNGTLSKSLMTVVVRDDTVTTDDAEAEYVEVTVGARTARYALTPIVGAVSSGAIDAKALAGLGSAICKVPPVMICNPQETGGNTNFDATPLIGKGLKLVSVGSGGGAWAPGNFGYLNTGGGSNGAPGLREALGWGPAPGNCIVTTGVDTKPGATVSVTDALNTRFDIYDSNVSCPTGGSCPASINSVKDLLRPGNANGNNACKMHNQGWQEASPNSNLYLPNATNALAPLPTTTTPKSMGHPRDMCHAADSSATGYCSGPIGTGAWDSDAYFRANYGWTPSSVWQGHTGLSPSVSPTTTINMIVQANPAYASRYNVYAWEIARRDQSIGGKTILGPEARIGNGANALTNYGKPICSAIEGYGSGTVPAAGAVDRRRLSVAVVNCTQHSVNGAATNVPVKKWLEVFLVEPSYGRGSASSGANARSSTHSGDVYVEVIGETLAGGSGATAGQVIRKDVPYLIE